MSDEGLRAATDQMAAAGVSPVAISVFAHYYRQLESGASGLLRERDIAPLVSPATLAGIDVSAADQHSALDATAVIKLNGGLGTSMGMQQAKSLLPVRGELTFLDVIARQVLAARAESGARIPLILMNSFRTREDSRAALAAYGDLAVRGRSGENLQLDFVQSKEPKLRADDLAPVRWPADPELEWCPPGHGDLYPALAGSGVLEELLDNGFRYAFVSNADNLGARVDGRIAAWFAASGAPFAIEVCRRTPADQKGGHLAIRRSDGRLVLRETAQTAPEDLEALEDLDRHRYFNSNNLWLDLRALDAALREHDGVLGLPLIRNRKTVDPSDPDSPAVVQIETAMGAAVEVFDGSVALAVDRSRFLPVKTTSDLLVLRSDAYRLDDDGGVRLADGRSEAPLVELHAAYKLLADFDARFAGGPPSLVGAEALRVKGDWTFGADVVVRGSVELASGGGLVPDGTLLD